MNTGILTTFRFFAATIVVIFHFGGNTALTTFAPGLLTSGSEMVIFFFVLSGFVMTVAYLRRNNFSTTDYWVARVARIYPAYILALIISIYFIFSKFTATKNPTGNDVDVEVSVLLNMFSMQAWLPQYSLTINPPAWSISVEFFLYACFPAVITLLREYNPSRNRVMSSALIIYIITQVVVVNLQNNLVKVPVTISSTTSLIAFFPIFHFGTFFLGVATAYYVINSDLSVSFRKKIFWSIFSCISIIGTLVALNRRLDIAEYFELNAWLSCSLYAPVFAILFYSCVNANNVTAKYLQSKPLFILGEASYSLYILHWPLYRLYQEFVPTNLSLSKDNHFYLYLGTLVLISLLTFYILERPSKRAILRLHNVRRRLEANRNGMSKIY